MSGSGKDNDGKGSEVENITISSELDKYSTSLKCLHDAPEIVDEEVAAGRITSTIRDSYNLGGSYSEFV
jgi:hypothetical protein